MSLIAYRTKDGWIKGVSFTVDVILKCIQQITKENLLLLKELLEQNLSVSKIVYTNNLADIINKCNNAYHITIKMKPSDVKPSRYIDFNKEKQ